MRTLTVYVVTHAEMPPVAVLPTLKQANAYVSFIQKDTGKCDNWTVDRETFNDNSTGVASFCNTILDAHEDDLVKGYEDHNKLELATALIGILAEQLTENGLTPKTAIDKAIVRWNAAGDLNVATPEAH